MAIFGFKKRKDDKLEQGAESAKSTAKRTAPSYKRPRKAAAKASTKAVAAPAVHSGTESFTAAVILRPRVTEKSGILSQGNAYTFEVHRDANKHAVARAVSAMYKVVPVKVAIINTPAKRVFVKGRKGTVAGMRKAVVTLKKGDKIDFV